MNNDVLKTKEQLIVELESLRKKSKQKEDELIASNQQLLASEQQLRATNQQLSASEQQLLATNQQLSASEQQLRAANQQLEATNQQLRASEKEAKLQRDLLLEAQKIAHISNWTFNPVTNIPWWPDELYKIYGLDPSNGPLSYEEHPKLVHPDDWEWFDAIVKETFETGNPYDIILRILRPSGEIRYINLICKTVLDESGAVIEMRGTVQDVTERIEAEQKLKQSEEKFRELYNQSPVAIQYYDAKGNLLDVNKKTLELYGIKNYDEIAEYNFFDSDKLSENNIQDLKEGKSIFIPDVFDFEAIKKHGYFKTYKTGILYVELLVAPVLNDGEIVAYLVHMLDVTEQKLANDKVSISEKKFRNLVENLQELVYRYELYPSPHFSYVSPNSTDLIGYTPQEHYDNPNLGKEIIHPDDMAIFEKYMAEDLNTKKSLVCRWTAKNGNIVWTEQKTTPIYDAENKIVAIEGISRNITSKLLAEKELKASEEKFRGVFEDSNVGIAIGTAQGEVIEVNDEYLKITGYSRQEYLKIHFTEITHPKDLEKEWPLFEQLLSGAIDNYRIEKRLKAKRGNYIWLDCAITARKDTNGNLDQILVFVVDITEGKKAAETVNVFFDQPLNLHLIASIEGVITKVNKGWEKTLGYTKEESIGKNIFDFVHPDDKATTLSELNELESGKTTFYFENRYLHKNGTYVTLAWSAIFNTTGKMLHGVAKDITQQKVYQEALIKSEENYRALSENAKHIILTHNFDGEITYVNQFGLDFINLPKEQLIGTDVRLLIQNEAELDKMQQRINDFLSGEIKVHQFIVNITLPSGDEKILEVIGGPIMQNGTIDSFLLTAYDISEREKARLELADSETKLKNIIENSTNLFYSHSVDNKITFISPQVKKITGYEPHEAMKQWTDFITDNPINKKAEEFTAKAIKTGRRQPTYEMEIQRKDGHKIIVEVREAPVVINGEVESIVGSITDITKRKKAEENILSISRRLQLSTESAHIGIWEYDIKRNNVNWDKRVFKIYGINPDNFGGAYQAWQKGVHPDDFPRVNKEVNEAIAGNKDFHAQFRIVWPNGDLRYVEAHAIVTHDQENNPQSMIGVTWDITAIKNTEINLINAKIKAEESDRLKSAFLSNMSHEIRTPMNGILGFTELLKVPHLNGDTRDRYIQIIEKSGNRMLNTINDIVDISKIEAGQVEVSETELSLNKLLLEQFNFFVREAEDKGLNLIYNSSVTDQESYIISDEHKLESILTNLIKNAIKYTDSGSVIFGYTMKTIDGHEACEFYVKDTGIGIPTNRMEAIFNRFEQADIEDKRVFEGSGLGLAISKSYVEMLGGSISVSSEEGNGSTFTFNIPYRKQNQEESGFKTSGEHGAEVSLKNISVIVAEDDEVSKMFLETILESEYGKIIYTSTGKETVDKCRENPDTDLILMDVKMPDMNGLSATKLIREFNKKVIIIAQTAYGLVGDKAKAIDAGCDDYIAKPIQREDLLEKIQNCMKNRNI